jgi:hypothetical protein
LDLEKIEERKGKRERREGGERRKLNFSNWQNYP